MSGSHPMTIASHDLRRMGSSHACAPNRRGLKVSCKLELSQADAVTFAGTLALCASRMLRT